jgi:hypothetical protein
LFLSPNFPIMIIPTHHGFRGLSTIAFSARLLVYALKRADIRAINLRSAQVSQPYSLILFVYLAALFCTRFKAPTWPSLYGSQLTAPYSSISLTSAVYCWCMWMRVLTGSQENITFAVCIGCVTSLSDWLLKLWMCYRPVVFRVCIVDPKGFETSSQGIHGYFSEMGTSNYIFFLNWGISLFSKNNHVTSLIGEVFVSYDR